MIIRRCVRRANRITSVKTLWSKQKVQIPVADLLIAQDERVDKRVDEAIQCMIDVHERSEERTREELKVIKMAIKESRMEADRNVERLRVETKENVERLRVELKGNIDSSHWKVMFGLGTVIVGLPSVAYVVFELILVGRPTITVPNPNITFQCEESILPFNSTRIAPHSPSFLLVIAQRGGT